MALKHCSAGGDIVREPGNATLFSSVNIVVIRDVIDRFVDFLGIKHAQIFQRQQGGFGVLEEGRWLKEDEEKTDA